MGRNERHLAGYLPPREIPKSTSSVNSVSQETTDPDRQVLDALKGLDQGVDSLFSFDSE